MTRKEFVLQSLRSGLLVSLAPPDWLLPPARDLLAWTRTAHHLFLYDTEIAGFQYYEGPDKIASLAEGDPLDLVREPENPHDSHAIAVYSDGAKLGFLPRRENYAIANLLDQKQILTCTVFEVNPGEQHWNQLFVHVHLLVPAAPGYDAWLSHA